MKRLAIVLVSLIAAPGAPYAQAQSATAERSAANSAAEQAGLGRLFLTPERRANLERQRQLNIREMESVEGETLKLNGVVQRSSGRSSVWINNRVQHENQGAVNVEVNRRAPSSATISSGNEAPTQLHVGESINRATRERNDVVGPDAVRPGKPRVK